MARTNINDLEPLDSTPAGDDLILIWDSSESGEKTKHVAYSDLVQGLTPADSSATAKGIVELATSGETITGTDTTRAVTPYALSTLTATDTRAGLVELATSAEALAGSLTTRAVTPAALSAAMTGANIASILDTYLGSSAWRESGGGGDTTAPTISTLSPADNASSVAIGSNLVVTFSEAIAIGTGSITIKNLSDSTQATIAITAGSPQIVVSGSTLTINPGSDLLSGTNYAIQIAATCIEDLTGNSFAGILNDTTWNFSTASSGVTVPGAPTIGTATALNPDTATVAFTAPGSNGGAAITLYTATSSPGGLTGTLAQAGSGTITVTGLSANTAYTFTVRATNSQGQSAASAASNSTTTGTITLTSSIGGISADSNVLTGGGTDYTSQLQSAIDARIALYSPGGPRHRLTITGAYRVSGLTVSSGVELFSSSLSNGFFLTSGSNVPVIRNANPRGRGSGSLIGTDTSANVGASIDNNIVLKGFSVNYNKAGNNGTLEVDLADGYAAGNTITTAIALMGIDSSAVTGVRIIDAFKWNFLISNFDQITFEDNIVLFQTPTGGNDDGLHLWPRAVSDGACRITVNNFTSNGSLDDIIGIAAGEGCSYADAIPGHIDITADGIHSTNNGRGVRISGTVAASLTNMTGTVSYNALTVQGDDPYGSGGHYGPTHVTSLILDGQQWEGAEIDLGEGGNSSGWPSGPQIDSMIIRNSNQVSIAVPWLINHGNITSLTLSSNTVTQSGTAGTAPIVLERGTITTLAVNGNSFTGGFSAGAYRVGDGATDALDVASGVATGSVLPPVGVTFVIDAVEYVLDSAGNISPDPGDGSYTWTIAASGAVTTYTPTGTNVFS